MQLPLSSKDKIVLRLREAEDADLRTTYINDVMSDEYITVEQTNPPLNNTFLSRSILVTFSSKDFENGRVGFMARIERFTADGRIVLHKLSDYAAHDLRMWPRVNGNFLQYINAYMKDNHIQLIDLSCGGSHVILNRDDLEYNDGSQIKLRLVHEGGETIIDGKVLRVWPDASRNMHAAIQFNDANRINFSLAS